MARRTSAAKIRKRDDAFRAARNIAVVVLLAGAVAFFYIQTIANHRNLNEETLCPAQPESLTVLLVDVTDPLNLPQRQDFLNQLDRLTDQIPRYGELTIAKVDPVSDRLLEPIITRCNPGSARDENDVSGNPQKLDQMRKERFVEPIRGVYQKLLDASAADRSPILESIQSVNLTEFQRPQTGDVPKRLIVASDLLQNTTAISFYKSLPDPYEFTATQQFNRVRTDLRGIEVELWMLQRDDSNQTQPRALPNLWEQLIGKQGGRLTRVYNVSG